MKKLLFILVAGIFFLQSCSKQEVETQHGENQDKWGYNYVEHNRVVIANRASGTISVIDSDNNSVISTHTMPNNGEPMYCVYNSYNNTVLVGDYNGKVVAFDGLDFTVKGEADAGNGVFHMWISPDNSQLWVNNELDKTISVIDPVSLTTLATIDMPADLAADGFKPHDVVISPNGRAAYVTYLKGNTPVNYVVKYNTRTFQERRRAAVGGDPHVIVSPLTNKLYVASQAASKLYVLKRSNLSQITTIDIPNAHGLGLSACGTYLYVGNIAQGGTAANHTVDLYSNTLVGSPVDAPFAAPHNYAVTYYNDKLFVTHSGMTNNKVSVYDLNPTPTLSTSLTVGANPFGLVAYTYYEYSY